MKKINVKYKPTIVEFVVNGILMFVHRIGVFFNPRKERECLIKSLNKPQKRFRIKNLKNKDMFELNFDDMKVYGFNNNCKNNVIFLHGGAYVHTANYPQINVVKYIAKQSNSCCYIPVYPLAPHYDVTYCLTRLEMLVDSLEGDITLIGDSAGGGLVLALNEYLKQKGKVRLKNLITICPWLDVTMQNENIKYYLKHENILIVDNLIDDGEFWRGELSSQDNLVSPVNVKLNKERMLMISGEHDILTPDIIKFCENNKDADITWYSYEKMYHDFTFYPTKTAKDSRNVIVDFINKQLIEK